MWNNVAEILQDPSTKRLALAIAVSALIHAYLVGGFNVRLPSLSKETSRIEARLQMPKVTVKESVKEQVAEEASIQTQPAVASLPEPAAQKSSALAPQVAEQVLNSDVSEPAPRPLSDAVPESSDLTQAEQPVDADLVINENAYQYVETEFDVSTQIDGDAEGTAKIVFNVLDDSQYKLTSLIKPQGLAALIVSDLLQTSEGRVTKGGLQPDRYLYQYGNKTDKTYAAKFDWQNKTVDLTTAKGTQTEQIADGTQDLLSFMYQFMYMAPLERMQISIATGKKLSNYDYSFSGEESINSSLGQINTIHIVHEGENSDEKTELWLAVDYQYLPVKIRKIEKNGKVYELVAKHINTTRPTLN